ncbi:hypothetical protein H5410_051340 [Solanum commersonii]|uniref:Uncharacterized protein n=1 Tax=Solanum commersonii TaxID=4109 RepID=A0A9J5WXX2_SOLCO|nr:hypothetical protein H5410_051340 [Solanum commersonii]
MRWTVPGVKKLYIEGLTLNVQENHQKSIEDELRFIASDLFEYLEIERKFKKYKLDWMSIEPGDYYLAMVREFYGNYVILLEKGKKYTTQGKPVHLNEIILRDVPTNISPETINQFLFVSNYFSLQWTTEYDHGMRDKLHQSPWFAQVMTNGQSLWLT